MRDEARPGIRDALAVRGVAPLLAVATVARLHVGGMGLAVLLLVEQQRASMASAGAAVAALSLGIGLTRPVQGRLIDRCGARCLAALALVHAFATALTIGVVAAGAPTTAIAAAAFALGFSAPSISVAVRAALADRVGPAARAAALGADTAAQDVAFAAGPLLAGAVAAAAAPRLGLLALVAVGCAGAVELARRLEGPGARRRADAPDSRCAAGAAPGSRPPSEAGGTPEPRPPSEAGAPCEPGRQRILSAPALRPILRPLAVSIALGVVYGALAVGAVAAVLERGGDGLAGPATAAVFAGGVCGDLLIAPRRPDLPLAVRLRRRLLALLALSALLVAVPGGVPLVVALLPVGAALAGASVTVVVDVAARAAPAVRAEAFGWAGATLRLGNALGAGLAGLAADALDARAALLVAVGGAALGCLAMRRRRIETGAVSVLARIGVAGPRRRRLPGTHETTPPPPRALRVRRRPAGAGLGDR